MDKDLGIELKACEYIIPIRSEGCIGFKKVKGYLFKLCRHEFYINSDFIDTDDIVGLSGMDWFGKITITDSETGFAIYTYKCVSEDYTNMDLMSLIMDAINEFKKDSLNRFIKATKRNKEYRRFKRLYKSIKGLETVL